MVLLAAKYGSAASTQKKLFEDQITEYQKRAIALFDKEYAESYL